MQKVVSENSIQVGACWIGTPGGGKSQEKPRAAVKSQEELRATVKSQEKFPASVKSQEKLMVHVRIQ